MLIEFLKQASQDLGESSQQKNKKRSSTEIKNGKSKKKSKHVEQMIDPTDFETEEVINLVPERPSLWDKKHPRHSDNVFNRRRWNKIYETLFPNYDSFGDNRKEVIAKLVRDSYFKFLRDRQQPSGSGTKKCQYKHAVRLQFLHKVQELDHPEAGPFFFQWLAVHLGLRHVVFATNLRHLPAHVQGGHGVHGYYSYNHVQ
ncbi:uncharacterized protein LOC130362415 isoform X2 [Hyla sarda]|uniref:uncharacterized protein LOC130362415 isoform X2 n=1 Tax=Hyla sarda TaxID=327740 RepID=UPI0024C2B1DB|nr:uncharacterized protein LOC130362415 isoform X2 [Hyla sarda]XP_056422822.1 uncharacterized protein LOC130362415 isoform X2 [Hyla sarda]XP_056422824.1 uncharacterized protein LOC130362415 isoform X2 [Hyla sarda]XP_056422825.1 uncharacterized protein LOC130362415 isoform X2 [Hyla sarda]